MPRMSVQTENVCIVDRKRAKSKKKKTKTVNNA